LILRPDNYQYFEIHLPQNYFFDSFIFSTYCSTYYGAFMNTITAQEIKRRGISAVKENIKKGPVHVILKNKPMYVILDEESFNKMIAEQEESYYTRLETSLKEYQEGKVKTFKSVDELMDEIS